MALTKVPNDVVNNLLLVGVQTAPGVPAVVTHRMNGNPDIDIAPSVTFDDDANGTYLTKTSPILGIPANTGSWGETAASFERLPSFLRAICRSGGTPASGSGPDYSYEQTPSLTEDDVDLLTVIFGTPGLLERYTDLRFSELTIAGDVDSSTGAWTVTATAMTGKGEQLIGFDGVATAGTLTTITMTGAGWTVDQWAGAYVFPHFGDNRAGARRILSNTATAITVETPFDVAPAAGERFLIGFLPPDDIPLLVEEKIKAAGTKLFLDHGASPLGTTQIKLRFISFSITIALNIENKVFMENENERSGVYGRGSMDITGQVRLEADRPDEFRQLLDGTDLKMRIEKEGTELAPGVRKRARIDIQELNWTQRTKDTRNNNKTQTLAFRATSAAVPILFATRNGLSVLPS